MTDASRAALATLLAHESDAALESVEEALAVLAHDVGKYVARVAKNVAPGSPVPNALANMLAKDLYETHQGKHASARFAELSLALPRAMADAAELSQVAFELREIDALEAGVRAADPAALDAAVALARSVEAALSASLRAARSERSTREAVGPACLPPSRGARG